MHRQRIAFFVAALGFAFAFSSDLRAQTIERAGTHFQVFPSPSLRVNDIFRIDFHFKVQEDHRAFPEEIEPAEAWNMPRERFGIEGMVLKRFEYRVEHDFALGGRWTDVFAGYRHSEALGFRAGKFKEPFSLEQTTSDFNLTFVLRPAIARDLAPGRGRGLMAHGRAGRVTSYELGVFSHDGENAAFSSNTGGDATLAARARVEPWRGEKTSPVRSLQFGVAATECSVPAGLNSLRARAIGGTPIYHRAYVSGPRVRLGTELSWTPGPFEVRSEFIQVWEDRAGQGTSGQDLPHLATGGWYVSGSWLLTHDRSADRPSPRTPLFQGGIGGLEAAIRYEHLQSGSGAPGQLEEDTPRAANLLESTYAAWTLGFNWYVNRWGKVQFNAIRESFDPAARSQVPGRSAYWSTLWRFQFMI